MMTAEERFAAWWISQDTAGLSDACKWSAWNAWVAADAEAIKRTAQRCVKICDENKYAGAEAACRAIVKEFGL